MDNGDDLPNYATSEAQNGNTGTRWNRWRGWVEKRAAERFEDEPRPSTGWGPTTPSIVTSVGDLNERPSMNRVSTSISPLPDYEVPEPPTAQGELLDPAHIALYSFGSRFLPHSTHRITAVLPILNHQFLLLGTTNGLSVLSVSPSLHSSSKDSPLSLNRNTPPLSDAVVIPLWENEAVHQLIHLDDQPTERSGDSQGVVLAVVGPPETKGCDPSNKAVRIYNLASLISLVRWAVAQKEHQPIDLINASPTLSSLSSPSLLRKHHRHQSSVSKSLKALMVEHQSPNPSPLKPLPSPYASPSRPSAVDIDPFHLPPTSSSSINHGYPMDRKIPQPPTAPFAQRPSSPMSSQSSLVSVASDSWDVVDDLPFRWATDYAPLATPGSKLYNVPVNFIQVGRNRGSVSLAVATKANIVLYEAPRGERAFSFVKEFYTPSPPKSLAFITQIDPSHRRSGNSTSTRDSQRSTPKKSIDYGTQISLFITFDKKAGLIRLGDAAVTELEPFPDLGTAAAVAAGQSHRRRISDVHGPVSPLSGGSLRRSLATLETGFWRGAPPWLPLCELALPPSLYALLDEVANNSSSVSLPSNPRDAIPFKHYDAICFITRGKTTQIFPLPLPVAFGYHTGAAAPLRNLIWHNQPKRVSARLCVSPETDSQPPFLQLIGFGEEGVEVQETNFNFLRAITKADLKGKSKTQGPPPDAECVRTCTDVGGAARLMVSGGRWDQPPQPLSPPSLPSRIHLGSPSRHLMPTPNFSSSLIGGPGVLALKAEAAKYSEGVYGSVCKGPEEFRVFWLGGGWNERSGTEDEDEKY